MAWNNRSFHKFHTFRELFLYFSSDTSTLHRLVLPPPYSCAACGTENQRLRFCSRCRNAAYCSKQCQTRHWAASHKENCCPSAASRQRRDNESISLEALIQEKFDLTYSEDPRPCDRCQFSLESFRTRIWSPPRILVIHLDRNSSIHGMITTCVLSFVIIPVLSDTTAAWSNAR